MASRISSREGCSVSWIRPTVTFFAPSGADGVVPASEPPEEAGALLPPQAVTERTMAMVSKRANSFFMAKTPFSNGAAGRVPSRPWLPPVGVAVCGRMALLDTKKRPSTLFPFWGETRTDEEIICGATLIAAGKTAAPQQDANTSPAL